MPALAHSARADPPSGFGLLQLVSAPKGKTAQLVERLGRKAFAEYGNSELAANVIELAEEWLIRKFSELNREELRKMFHLEDLRKTRVWQEAHEEGKGDIKKELAEKWLDKGMSPKQIAELLEVSQAEVRRWVNGHPH